MRYGSFASAGSYSNSKCLVPLMVLQADPDIPFLELFIKIARGRVLVIAPPAELVEAEVERIFVGSSRECMSVVDQNLLISDVCKVFGQYVRYNVVRSLPNSFTILMNSSAKQSIAASS